MFGNQQHALLNVALAVIAAVITPIMLWKSLPILLPFAGLIDSTTAAQQASSAVTSAPPVYPTGSSNSVDLSWHAPRKYAVNSLASAINGTGIYGFIFNSSQSPAGSPPSLYNWCNMPHVNPATYPKLPKQYASYELVYAEAIHRHHKRTPYSSNAFPVEAYGWDCTDEALYYYGAPAPSIKHANHSAQSYWAVAKSPQNPFSVQGFSGSCDYPQITKAGLDDSWQHGVDLWGVYGKMLRLIPKHPSEKQFRISVSNNVITSQVAGMLLNGMLGASDSYPLHVEPPSVAALEPTYSCPFASGSFSSYGVGSSAPNWTVHLTDSRPLVDKLDAISGVNPSDNGWHQSWDHYFDNLSARLCHQKPLPCNITNPTLCVTQEQANEVFRLGQYEYSFIYRDAPQSLAASVASYGVWVGQLAAHLREASAVTRRKPEMAYRHNVAHDGSVSRLLSILQLDEMVWPGMGSEVVFELYRNEHAKFFVRILWSGQVLKSSTPVLGRAEMVPLETVLAYFDGLVGVNGSLIPGKCAASS